MTLTLEREEPLEPPVKAVILKMSPEEARNLRRAVRLLGSCFVPDTLMSEGELRALSNFVELLKGGRF